jgi:5-dehydro-2-deoxygluconokinase
MSVEDQPAPAAAPTLDVICIGRAAVDLYGEQLGSRLEDVQTFARYLGGSPTNTAVGAARLGLRAAVLSRVGDEHNGRFVRESLQREGVDVAHLRTDPTRLTALVFLGLRDENTFPLLFYRDRCADMALSVDDIDEGYVAGSYAVLISGTHLSHPDTRAACMKAIQIARLNGRRVALDIDYRPVLWGLTSPGLGEQRYVPSAAVSEQLQAVLPLCDLIVGTEEEVHIAGGSSESRTALRRIRELSQALLVMKRGPLGCVAYPEGMPIPDDLDDGVCGPGFPVEVFNVLGAGDAFMAGLLRGWVRGEPLPQALRYANACGAIVVSRHGCAPAMPTWPELAHFLACGSAHRRLRDDRTLEHLHRVSTRRPWPMPLAILAFDHRTQLEELAQRRGAAPTRVAQFKRLVAQAAEHGYAQECAARLPGEAASTEFPLPGVIVDDRHGQSILNRLTGGGVWIGRPVELPGSRPLEFEAGGNVGLALRGWPADHVVKCLVSCHPDDETELQRAQTDAVQALAQACDTTGHELLLELVPPSHLPQQEDTVARAMAHLYQAGVRPAWWKLPPPTEPGWARVADCIQAHDPHCRGVLLLGLEASEDTLQRAFQVAARQPMCRGFAVGRTLFGAAALAWFAGTLDDAGVVADVATRYRRLIRLWQHARAAYGPAGTSALPSEALSQRA